jgi:two-component system chemotaxis sensor kinase CheA
MKSDRPIAEFLAEAEDILESASAALLTLEDGQARGGADADTVNGLFRALHSFKGLAGMFGLTVLADVAHKLEFLLDEVRLGKVALGRETLDVLADTLGLVGRLVHQTGKGRPLEDTAAACTRIDRVLAAKTEGAEDRSLLSRVTIDPGVLQVLTEYEEHRLIENIRERKNLFLVRVSFSFAEFENGIRALTDALKQHSEIICTLPTAAAGGDGIGFTLVAGTAETREALAAGAPAVFEASFLADGVFAAVDVLEQLEDGFALIEVKSSYSVKPQFIPDVAIQVHVARAAGGASGAPK